MEIQKEKEYNDQTWLISENEIWILEFLNKNNCKFVPSVIDKFLD